MIKTIFQPFSHYRTQIVMAVLTLLASSVAIQATESTIKNSTIKVTATGESHAAPDMATIDLAVITNRKTAQEALEANNKSINGIVTALKKNGIQENDLQTSGFSIYQNDSDKHNETKKSAEEYQVFNVLRILVRDLPKAGKIFDQAIKSGVTVVHGIDFSNANTKPFYQEARKKAIAEALEKAKTIAQAANVKLGKIIEINEHRDNHYPTPRLTRSAAQTHYSENTNFSGGTLSYNVNVTMVFAID
ncbi:SIMPL domain-containing protein [Bartonella sp. CB169]|uniref:SIMPL domain-containing protein n=1 Tax=Bartonella sp. CB169 TaxID=3112257 RepID=UPI00300DC2CA